MNATFLLLLLLVAMTFVGCSPGRSAESSSRMHKPPATSDDDIAVYFSPRGGAMAAVLHQINQAHRSIDVQAYLITANEIADALKAAHERGVEVRVILDKDSLGGMYSAAVFFADSDVPVWRDGQHKEAHDKVMLIDGRTIITGSFNFTRQAEDANAENLLIIRNKPRLFAAYLANFQAHLKHSEPLDKP